MPRQPEKEPVKKPASSNIFAALADSSDSEGENAEAPPPPPVPPAAPVAPVAPASPPLRSWGTGERKFPDQTVFSSPFNKNRRRAKPQEDEHGWVSLKPQLVESEEDERPITPVTYEPRTPPFGPEPVAVRLAEPVAEAVLPEIVLEERIGGTGESADGMSAMAWAERIKKSLEKAEAARTAKVVASKGVDEEFKEALGRLSFFRRPMAVAASPEK